MTSRIYVIGHVNPDTDSIAAAVGYAWLLRERDGTEAVAARAGATNPAGIPPCLGRVEARRGAGFCGDLVFNQP